MGGLSFPQVGPVQMARPVELWWCTRGLDELACRFKRLPLLKSFHFLISESCWQPFRNIFSQQFLAGCRARKRTWFPGTLPRWVQMHQLAGKSQILTSSRQQILWLNTKPLASYIDLFIYPPAVKRNHVGWKCARPLPWLVQRDGTVWHRAMPSATEARLVWGMLLCDLLKSLRGDRHWF